jgi:hypothetical protein
MAAQPNDGAGDARQFIAVATGQNLANLPPIIEMARPGDAVLWLETAQAQRAGWADGARRILARRGLANLPPLPLPEEPAAIIEAVRAVLASPLCPNPVFVHNGGTKTTALAIEAAAGTRPRVVLYGQEAPAELWLMPDGIGGPLHRAPYRGAALTLGEILACRGYGILNPAEARRIWPDAAQPGDDDYGSDADATAAAHDAAFARSAALAAAERGFAAYGDLATLAPAKLARWVRTTTDQAAVFQREAGEKAQGTALARRYFESIFNGALRLSRGLTAPAQVPAAQMLGPRFERAVARRLRHWLERHGAAHHVTEAWHGVKVGLPGKGGVEAEWDLVLVLSNAVVVSIECKTFDVVRKDLDARLLNLQRATTRPSRMTVCLPVYTEFHDREWMRDIVGKLDRMRATGQEYLPFTLQDQPRQLSIRRADGTWHEEPVPSFEEALAQSLARYRRTTAA